VYEPVVAKYPEMKSRIRLRQEDEEPTGRGKDAEVPSHVAEKEPAVTVTN